MMQFTFLPKKLAQNVAKCNKQHPKPYFDSTALN